MVKGNGKNTVSMTPRAIKRRERRQAKRQGMAAQPSQPKRKGKGASGNGQLTQVVSGVDVLGVITLRKNDQPGKPLLRFVVNPAAIPESRVGQYTGLWQRWAPVSLRLEISSAAGMMIPGAYIVGWFADPSEELVGETANNIARIVTCGCSVQQPVGLGAMLNIPCQMSRKWYSFRGDAFDDSHGVILAAVAGNPGGTEVTLTVKLHWRIRFNGPDLPRVSGEDAYIQPEGDFIPVFTDSTSDWAEGKKLTFKHSEGGQVVPWEGIQPGVVYVPTKGVKITYKKGGQNVEVKFFSMMLNAAQYQSALVCHESEDKAQSYQKTGNVDHVLNYEAAGDWATPDSPVLKAKTFSSGLHLVPSTLQAATGSRLVATRAPQPSQPAPEPGVDAIVDRLLPLLISRLGSFRDPGPSTSSSVVVLDPPEDDDSGN